MQASHVTWKSCDISEFGDDDLATAELDETFATEGVEHAGDIKTTGVDLRGKTSHEDAELLGTGGNGAVGDEEMDDTCAVVGKGGMPQVGLCLLGGGGKDVEVVDAEDIKLLEEKHHLRLGYRHEIAGGEGGEGGGVALGETEESLNLNDVGGLDGIAYCISVVGGVIFETETAVGEDDDRLAAVALADDATAGRMLEEVELGVGDNLLEVVACHTHEERQLEQGGKSYHRAILSFMLGENHTSLAPSAPARMK